MPFRMYAGKCYSTEVGIDQLQVDSSYFLFLEKSYFLFKHIL